MKTIKLYNEDAFLMSLDENEAITLKLQTIEMICAYNEEIATFYSRFSSVINGEDIVYKLASSVIMDSLYKIDEKIQISKGFIKIFESDLEQLLSKYIKFYDQIIQGDLRDKIVKLYTILINKTKKLIFKFFLCNNASLTSVRIKHLNFYHFTALNHKIKDLYYDETKLDIKNISKLFGISAYRVDESLEKEGINCDNRLVKQAKKLKLNFINTNYDDQFGSASNYIDLKFLYDQADYHPCIIEIVKDIDNNVKYGSTLNIALPIFLETNSELLSSFNHGYMKIYFEYLNFYKHIIEEVGTLSKSFHLNIVIPNSMGYKDYLWWYVTVKELLRDNKTLSDVKIGVVLDDFDVMYDIEKYENTDFVLIDFDELSYNLESNNSSLTVETFKDELEVGLREVHEILKTNNIKHPIISYNLNNESIIEKLLIMGFRDFIYPPSLKETLNCVVNNYSSRRGKYRGISKKN